MFTGIAAIIAGEAITAAVVLTAVAEVGLILTVAGAVTGDEDLMKIGGVMSLVGGVGSLIASGMSAATSAATNVAADAATQTAAQASTQTAAELAAQEGTRAATQGIVDTAVNSSTQVAANTVADQAAQQAATAASEQAMQQAAQNQINEQMARLGTDAAAEEVAGSGLNQMLRGASSASSGVSAMQAPVAPQVQAPAAPAAPSGPLAGGGEKAQSGGFFSGMKDFLKDNKEMVQLSGYAMMGMSQASNNDNSHSIEKQINWEREKSRMGTGTVASGPSTGIVEQQRQQAAMDEHRRKRAQQTQSFSTPANERY